MASNNWPWYTKLSLRKFFKNVRFNFNKEYFNWVASLYIYWALQKACIAECKQNYLDLYLSGITLCYWCFGSYFAYTQQYNPPHYKITLWFVTIIIKISIQILKSYDSTIQKEDPKHANYLDLKSNLTLVGTCKLNKNKIES